MDEMDNTFGNRTWSKDRKRSVAKQINDNQERIDNYISSKGQPGQSQSDIRYRKMNGSQVVSGRQFFDNHDGKPYSQSKEQESTNQYEVVHLNPYMEEAQKLKYFTEFMDTGSIKKLNIDDKNSVKPV